MSEDAGIDGVVLQIELESDGATPFAFANHVVTNHDAGHFYIRFFQVAPPVVLGDDIPDHVKGVLVANVVVPAWVMPNLVQALGDNFSKFQESMAEEGGEK